mmetsp:Transcript_118465/g.235968  ORF Transcript_118465/g.235968 Transcript_118465/m.235968 type:complete len:313 (+) Transcript_118465:60-998(+)
MLQQDDADIGTDIAGEQEKPSEVSADEPRSPAAAANPSGGGEYIVAEDFIDLVKHASQIESVAMELDRAGDAEQAVACYRQAADRLSQAVAVCPVGASGSSNGAILSRHAGQLVGRVVYLDSLCGAPASVPLEEHIGYTQLQFGEDGVCHAGEHAGETLGWKQQATSAAAVGGTAGLLVLHSPLVAVVIAAGAAYATTRGDSAGDAARAVGNMGIEAAEHAQTAAEKHQVTEKVDATLGHVRAMDEKYGITDKTQAAASASWEKLRELNRKHQVTDKLASGAVVVSSHVASASAKAAAWVARTGSSGDERRH